MSPRLSRSEGGAKGRLEAFSDGVFAIAITLLVLEIAVPHVAGDRLLEELLHLRTIYLAYFVAFMAIGIAWIDHSALTEALDHVDGGFQRLNLLLLLLVGFLPFPTSVMAEYLSLVEREPGGERVAVAFFGIALLLISLVLLVLGRYAEREGLFGDDLADERAEENRIRYQLVPSLILYAVAIGCGLIWPYVAVVLYILIGVFLLLPMACCGAGCGAAKPTDPPLTVAPGTAAAGGARSAPGSSSDPFEHGEPARGDRRHEGLVVTLVLVGVSLGEVGDGLVELSLLPR